MRKLILILICLILISDPAHPDDREVITDFSEKSVSVLNEELRKLYARIGSSGMAFSAYLSNDQTVTSGSFQVVNLDAEEYDTGDCFDVSTHKFTPNVAGKYFITATAFFNSSVDQKTYLATIRKNGTVYKHLTSVPGSGNGGLGMSGAVIVEFNGSTDYIELCVYQNSGGDLALNKTLHGTFLQGYYLRS